jgi:hypothetical protein
MDADIDYYLHKLENDPTALYPHVVTVYKDGTPVGMLLGQAKRGRMTANISSFCVLGPRATVLEVAHGGRLGPSSAVVDQLIASVLVESVRHGYVDLLRVKGFSLSSPLLCQLRKLVKPFIADVYGHSVLAISGSADTNAELFGGKTRRELRRKMKILKGAFGQSVEFKCFSKAWEINDGIRDAISVEGRTWQYFAGWSVLNTPRTLKDFEFFAERGWIRVFVLYVDRVPCAFLIGQVYGNTFHCEHVGYDQSFAQYSVGSLLSAWAFESLAEVGVQRVDLGDGGQEHFRRMGGEVREEGTIQVYSHTAVGGWCRLFFAVTGGLRLVGHLVLSPQRREWIYRKLFYGSRAAMAAKAWVAKRAVAC